MFGLFNEAKARAKFAQDLIARVSADGWPYPLAYDADRFAIDLGGDLGLAFLGPGYNHWSEAAKADKPAAFEEAVAYVKEQGPVPAFDAVRSVLFPLVRDRVMIDTLNCEPRDGTFDMDGVWRPMAGQMALILSLDLSRSTRHLQRKHFDQWGVSFEEALEVAMTNLRTRPGPNFQPIADGAFQAMSGDKQDASRLLTPDAFEGLAIKGDPVAIAVARDGLFVAGSEDDQALEGIALAALRHRRDSAPISYLPVILKAGQWEVFHPPAHLIAMSGLPRHQAAYEYDVQAPWIQRRLEREQRATGGAGLILLPTIEGDRSVALWTEPDCLIPVADFVVIKTGRGATIARAWADVDAALGGLPRESNTATPWAIAREWPSGEAGRRIIAAPDPEWARGKGLGVVDGRLTMMG